MDLSPEEMAELEALRKEQVAYTPKTIEPLGDLSPEEMGELESLRAEQNGPDRPVQAAIQGFGKAASFGYLPQIQAGAEKLVDSVFGDNTDEQLRAQGFQLPGEQSYVQKRDQYIKDAKSLEESNPKASLAGGVAGGLASGLATGGMMGAGAKVASLGQRIGTAAKAGATIGALRNPGDTEGEVDPSQLKDRIKNATFDAATGVVLQGGMEGIGKVAKAIKESPQAIKAWSQIKAFKTSGAMLKDFRKAFGNKKVAELGQTMIDSKIVSLGDDVADIAKKADILRQDTGSTISKIYESADDALDNLDPKTLTPMQTQSLLKSELDLGNFSKVYKLDLEKRFRGLSGSSTVLSRITKELDDIAVNGKVGLKKLREIRQSIDEQINFSKSTGELKGVQEELLNMRNKLQDLAKQRVASVDRITGTRMARDLVKANKDYSNLAEITKIAQDRVARDSTNAAFGLRERITGGAGAVVGGMIGGVPGAVAGGVIGSITTKVAKEYGTPFVAIASNRAARALESNKALLGKFADPLIKASQSPAEFVAAVDALMKEPEFKTKIQNINVNKIRSRGLAKSVGSGN